MRRHRRAALNLDYDLVSESQKGYVEISATEKTAKPKNEASERSNKMRIKRYSLLIFASLTICALLYVYPIARAQQPVAKANQVPLPVMPLIVEYEYVPQYFMQWISDDPQYSMIEAQVSKSNPPIYQIVLTEKGSRRQVYYCNSEAKVKALVSVGNEAHFTPIDFKATESDAASPTYGFAFRDARGQPIIWRFIFGSQVSERGAGLTPRPTTPGLLLTYRNRGSVAKEGTAVQIGDRVSEAEVWKEISAPPHFIAYRGSYTEGMNIGTFLLGKETWRVTSAPSELREGAEWKLTSDRGRERTLRITARRGDELTITESGSQTTSATLELNALATPQGLALSSILLKSGLGAMRITFKPELQIRLDSAAANNTEVAFQIDQGNREKVAQGSVFLERQGNRMLLRWQPKSPDWARSRGLNTAINLDATGYTIEVSQ